VTRAHVPIANVQRWVSILLAVYSVGLLVSAPVLGWIADKSETRRLPLLGGLLLLSGATVMLCIGTSISILVVGRLLQGFSASVVWATGLALLVDTVSEKEVGHTMGIISFAYSTGIVTGPLLGGIVYAKFGYYAVFYMPFGLIATDIVLRLSFIEKKVARRWLSVDSSNWEAAAATTAAALNQGESHGLERREPWAPDPEDREPRRVVPPKHLPPVITLLKSRRMLTAFWGCLVIATLYTAFDTTLPLYVNRIFGFNSLGSGLLFLALLLPNSTGPIVGEPHTLSSTPPDPKLTWPPAGRLTDRYGPRWLSVVALPFWVLLRLVTHKAVSQVVLLSALLVLIGASTSLAMTPLMAEFTYVVEAKERRQPGLFGPSGAYAQAYALFNMAWAAGSIVGPLWAGFVQAKAGWATMTWTLGLLSAVSAVPVVIYTGGLISRKPARAAAGD